MKLYFLGTGSSYPTAHRGVSSLAVQFEDGAVWLFDSGEGTQIQLQKLPIPRRKIKKIFITHLHGDHLFGLPGLMCTISSQLTGGEEEKTQENVQILDLYGPLGLRKFIYTALSISRSPLIMNYRVHELEPTLQQYPDDWTEWCVDHDPPTLLHPNELPGRIIKHSEDHEGNISWKIFDELLHSVDAGMIHHRIPSFGFVIKEKDRPGTLLVGKLRELGIEPGPFYGKLKSGKSIILDDGREVHPEDVLGPPMKGRTIVICGDSGDSSPMSHLVKECDILVHESTHDDSLLSKAQEFGHSTPKIAAEFCKQIKGNVLLLNHFSQRYSNRKNEGSEHSTDLLLKQAESHLLGSGIKVHCTHDLFTYNVEREKRAEIT